jgi:hypothetical protein
LNLQLFVPEIHQKTPESFFTNINHIRIFHQFNTSKPQINNTGTDSNKAVSKRADPNRTETDLKKEREDHNSSKQEELIRKD